MKMNFNLQENGGVYVIENENYNTKDTNTPLIKIGRSGKENIEERIVSMNKESAVPTDFSVNSITETPANRIVEKLAHEYHKDERIGKKEFFRTPANEASKTVGAIKDDIDKHSFVKADCYNPMTKEEKEEWFNAGYVPNDLCATPCSDATYFPNAEECPLGLDKDKWKDTIENIKLN